MPKTSLQTKDELQTKVGPVKPGWRLRAGGLAGLLGIVGALFPCWSMLWDSQDLHIGGRAVLVSQRAPEAVTNIAASIHPVPSNITDYDQGENYLSDIQVQSYLVGGDVFIFADVPSPSGLENYSAGIPVQRTDAFVNLDPGILPSTSEAPHVLMGKLKLEEVGTMWSQPRLPVAAILPSPDVSFRPSAETHPDRSWTYQLQWWATPQEERPLMYKLQWWTNQDDLLITQDMLPDHDLLLVRLQHSLPSPQAHELRWRK